MRKSAVAIAALLMISCSGQEKGGNEAAGNEAGGSESGGTAAAASLQPGQWETRIEVTKMSVPNMPQGMSPPLPPPTSVSYCLTPEQAAQPNANFLTGSGESGGCTYENFSMRNGRLQGTVQCNHEGATMRSTMDGSFSATSYEINSRAQTSMSGMTMEMETRTSARRTGDCRGG